MRQTKSFNGLTVKAYAGTTGVLLAFNVTAKRRSGLLGFAIERQKGAGQPWEWLNGMIPFPGQPHEPGAPIPSNVAPIQKFRWSDYAVDPETNYKFRVHGMYGDWRTPVFVKGPTVSIRTASNDADGVHSVNFNRAAGASQAFSRKFKEAVKLIETARHDGTFSNLTVDDLDRVNPGCKQWLARYILSQIIDVLDDAVDATWALDIAIYEYEWHEIVQAVNDAAARGAHIRLLYHSKVGDKQTAENEHHAQPLILAGKARARVTKALFHQKYIVLSRATKVGGKLVRTPHTVLCGSTNFTHNGLFRQANVVHVVRPELGGQTNPIAERYAAMFEQVWNGQGPVAAVEDSNKWITTHNPLDPLAPLFAGFSPRAKKADLNHFVNLIAAAKNDVLFSTAFELPKEIVDALKGKEHDPILRLGVQNRNDNQIAGFHRDRTAQFAAVALLDHGFDG